MRPGERISQLIIKQLVEAEEWSKKREVGQFHPETKATHNVDPGLTSGLKQAMTEILVIM